MPPTPLLQMLFSLVILPAPTGALLLSKPPMGRARAADPLLAQPAAPVMDVDVEVDNAVHHEESWLRSLPTAAACAGALVLLAPSAAHAAGFADSAFVQAACPYPALPFPAPLCRWPHLWRGRSPPR